MTRSLSGGIPLFRAFGIQVFLHWSWFVIALIEVQQRNVYDSKAWNLVEYLGLFAIVTLHEFGHALACRSVGGRADRIMLWPLGGVAFVSPPPRPGAYLWSIAAGPLVNVVLIPILYGIWTLVHAEPDTNLHSWLYAIQSINIGLLVFNILPIYPLDGGQILRSLLWFALGAGQSLRVATVIGMVGAAAGLALALFTRQSFLVLIAAFAAWQCWIGFQQASLILRMEAAQNRKFEV